MLLIGYLLKRTTVPGGWSIASLVSELCSVSTCLAPAPEDWVKHFSYNDLGFFKTCADALSVLPRQASDFSLFAYRLLPLRFSEDRVEPFEIVAEGVEPLAASFVSLGFDVINRTVPPFFECSPLSCNGMADEVPVNRFCLLATLDEAIAFAQRCAREEPEPGPLVLRGTA
jgi:hypothetical protein